MDNAVKTLLWTFETGDVGPPAPASHWAFIGAVPYLAARTVFADAHLHCEQPFRPDYLALQKAGYSVTPALPDRMFDGALVLLGKHRRLNEANIARASRITRPGGLVLVAGDKKLGGASARSWAGRRTALDGALSKHHAVAFWFQAHADAFGDVDLPVVEPVPGYHARPGMFCADRVDAGSALLAQSLDRRIKGAVADYGAGWGYLSGQLLSHAEPATVDLFEADKAALDQALDNIKSVGSDVPVTGHWLDLTVETTPNRFDWVIMNPPFHTARASTSELGQQFIKAAATSLQPDGRLLMVANRHLPYERVLAELFSGFDVHAEGDGFKVIEARRPNRKQGQPTALSRS